MKPLVIASTFAPSELNKQWYKLQKRFIEKSTNVPYDYKIILNGASAGDFNKNDILIENKENRGHAYALGQILDYFRDNPYESYLILDSDCFPVWDGWYNILTGQMRKFNKIIAAPVRTENLDLFPHPSAFFILGDGANDPMLDFSQNETVNMLADRVNEVAGAMQCMRDKLLPLLRTNVLNRHPVAAAVYHHLFYHHGAGSRDFNFRILKRYDYYQHWFDQNEREKQCSQLFESLMRNPEEFIFSLMFNKKCRMLPNWLSFQR